MWLIPSFFSALSLALQGVFIKKGSLHLNTIIITWGILIISSLLYIPILLIKGVPAIHPIVLISVGIAIIFDSAALMLYVQGIKISPLSLTMPMMSFAPLFVLFVSMFINHLFPSMLGVAGVLVTLVGVYLINFDHDTKHILSPFKAVLKERGVLYIILAAFLWSIVDSLKKLGIDNSNAYFYTAFYQIVWAVCFTPFAFFLNRKEFLAVLKKDTIKRLFPIGFFDATQAFSFNIALVTTLPAYVQSVRNTSILMSTFLGWYFFKEKVDKHLIPTIIIIAGVTLIAFA